MLKKDELMFYFTLIYSFLEPQNCLGWTSSHWWGKASCFPRTLISASVQVNSLVMGRRAAVSFNISWLEDLYEERLMELSGERVTPLVSNPGRIMLTSSRLYFQPYNNVEVEPVLKLKLAELQFAHKRRYMLRHVVHLSSLQVFWPVICGLCPL